MTLTPEEQAEVEAARPATPAPPTVPPPPHPIAILLARLEASEKQIVLMRTRLLRAEMTIDGIINLLANSAGQK
jgi:hypothetical protein